jgi:ubiquitin carboxyl-terminal hydrolase 5/13
MAMNSWNVSSNSSHETTTTTTNNNTNHDTAIFLRIVKEYVMKNVTTTDFSENETPIVMPTQLALGVPGGFQSEEEKYETITHYSVVVLAVVEQSNDRQDATSTMTVPKVLYEIPYDILTEPNTNVHATIPTVVRDSIHSIIHHVGDAIQTDVQAWNASDMEEIPISKYCHTIPFIENGIMIDPHPSSWKCQKTQQADDNLWLNLSDGYIGGGRKHWDVRRVLYFLSNSL